MSIINKKKSKKQRHIYRELEIAQRKIYCVLHDNDGESINDNDNDHNNDNEKDNESDNDNEVDIGNDHNNNPEYQTPTNASTGSPTNTNKGLISKHKKLQRKYIKNDNEYNNLWDIGLLLKYFKIVLIDTAR